MNFDSENNSVVTDQESLGDSLHVDYYKNYCSILWKVYGKDANLNIQISCSIENVQKYVGITLVLIQKLHEMKQKYGYDFCGLLTHVVPELNKFSEKKQIENNNTSVNISVDKKTQDNKEIKKVCETSENTNKNKTSTTKNTIQAVAPSCGSIEEDLGNLLNISQEDLEKLSKQLLQ